MSMLYRGVSKRKDSSLKGQLIPSGQRSEVAGRHDGRINYDGKFNYGQSENNAARAQQIETGLYGGCFISTTKDEKEAILFATCKFTEPGWVYVIDSSLFENYGVESIEFADPLYPDEKEVSIRSADCGPIPLDVVVDKYEVDSYGNRKT